jgi:hypothetical protein
MTVLTNVLSLIVACVVGVGPVALLAVLQNRRDRREQALFHEVATQLPAEALRSDVAVGVWCRCLAPRDGRLDLGRAAPAGVGMTARLGGACRRGCGSVDGRGRPCRTAPVPSP